MRYVQGRAINYTLRAVWFVLPKQAKVALFLFYRSHRNPAPWRGKQA